MDFLQELYAKNKIYFENILKKSVSLKLCSFLKCLGQSGPCPAWP